MKKKMIALDADYLLFEVCEGSYTKKSGFTKSEGDKLKSKKYKEPLKKYKQRMKKLIKDVENEVAVALLGKVKIKGIRPFFSDPNSNFRYPLFPAYKSNRKSDRSKLFYRMRKWAHKKWGYVPNTEADDVVAMYAREKGYIIATFDKDLLRGCPGIHFDVYHTRRHIVETSPKQAMDFTLIQTLTGDNVDGIPGLPRVAEKTAIKLLDEFGWDWEGVVKAYKSKGLTEKDAILTRRLIGMDQLHTTKNGNWKVKLFKP